MEGFVENFYELHMIENNRTKSFLISQNGQNFAFYCKLSSGFANFSTNELHDFDAKYGISRF